MPASNRITALFASPLIFRDKNGNVTPLDHLNFSQEKVWVPTLAHTRSHDSPCDAASRSPTPSSCSPVGLGVGIARPNKAPRTLQAMLLASLSEGCDEVGRQIELRVRAATTDSLRSVVTLGSRAIHYAGHGHPDFLSFEDGRGGVHAVDVDVLGALFAAGGSNETQLVFVSACFSRRAGEAFVQARADAYWRIGLHRTEAADAGPILTQ